MSATDDALLKAMEQGRKAASDAIIDSAHAKRLIVAGPGTGKSFTFKRALTKAIEGKAGARGLALTFIRNLERDLSDELAEVADVFTFHRFCKHLMHKHDVAGLRDGDYYPPLLEIVAEDLEIIEGLALDEKDITTLLHKLDGRDGIIAKALDRADYYGAVSHTDLVYRVLRHFSDDPDTLAAYPLIVVDEYQDFSLLETRFLELLARKSPVLVAGDDDQALYAFKGASPEFIRDLAAAGDYTVFPLPYCSRCTAVIVSAVKDVIARAVALGYLVGRLDKAFECYLPDKKADSAAHPKIIHVACSTANEPYAGQYIVQQIARIPAADIVESRARGNPTVLVIGPDPFRSMAFREVTRMYPRARSQPSSQVAVDILDGYRRIAKRQDSRLGWRIILACSPLKGSVDLHDVLNCDEELVECLPYTYVEEHRKHAQSVLALLQGERLSPGDETALCAAANRSLAELRAALAIKDPDEVKVDETARTESEPDIVFATLVGSKGLSAEHVFVLGFNNKHFPRDNNAVTDDDICSLIVALSRTRKTCHVVSFWRLGPSSLELSVFLNWIRRHLSPIKVNKDYDFGV